MLSQDELKALQIRTFQLDCGVIKLYKQSPEQPEFEGSGFIGYTNDNRIIFKIFVPHGKIAGGLGRLLSHSYKPGTLIPDEDYYFLEAIDWKGRKWK